MKKKIVLIFISIFLGMLFFYRGNFSAQAATDPESLHPKVLLIIFNPIIESQDNKKLTEVMDWYSPDELTSVYIEDLREVSEGFLNYEIAERMEIDDIPQQLDGFDYTDQTYLECLEDHSTCHSPDEVDYQLILDQYDVCTKLNQGQIDELWLFGGPWFGYYESRLAGPGAFRYNSPPLTGTDCNELLSIMGFNYERGEGEMLESFGHRAESTMTHVYGGWDVTKSRHNWDRFGHNRGQTPDVDYYQCGSVHYGPNSLSDYDWSNRDYVLSNCDDWLNYPDFTGAKKQMNCTEWGCDMIGHHKWWLRHLPQAPGRTNGILNNWWRYVVDLSEEEELNLNLDRYGVEHKKDYPESGDLYIAGEADLSWNQIEDAECYNIYSMAKNLDGSGRIDYSKVFSTCGTDNPGQTTYEANVLAPDAKWYYKVSAVDENGNELLFSNQVSFKFDDWCYDGDYGKDYSQKAKAQDWDETLASWDKCVNNSTLEEHFCVVYNKLRPKKYYRDSISHACSNGYVCQSGACVGEQAPIALSLSHGWNIISSPTESALDLSTIEQYCDDLGIYLDEKVWTYDTAQDDWIHPSHIASDTGAYIYANSDCTVELEGTPAEFTEKSIPQGWNIISTGTSLQDIVNDCNVRSDPAIWELVPPGVDPDQAWTHPSMTDTLDQSQGYWIKVDSDCTLRAEEIPRPPVPPGLLRQIRGVFDFILDWFRGVF